MPLKGQHCRRLSRIEPSTMIEDERDSILVLGAIITGHLKELKEWAEWKTALRIRVGRPEPQKCQKKERE